MLAFRASRMLAFAAVGLVAAACSDDETTAPSTPAVSGSLTVDAASAPAYVSLGSPTQAVTVADPSASVAWDFSAFGTTITSNGGGAGPGGVSLYCLCNNAAATATQLQAMTPATELAAFNAVTSASIPAADAFAADVLAPSIAGWFDGTAGATATARASRHWIIRLASTPQRIGKVRITQITGATANAAGTVTVEVATQPAEGGAFGATRSFQVPVGAAPVRVNLSTGAVTTGNDWDLAIGGWTIRVNGGVSGFGGVATVVSDDTPFAVMSATIAATIPPQVYRADSYTGVFGTKPWYRYNITGTDNQIWPTYEVYLLKRGTAVWKIQFTGYYDAAGTARQISFRYEQL